MDCKSQTFVQVAFASSSLISTSSAAIANRDISSTATASKSQADTTALHVGSSGKQPQNLADKVASAATDTPAGTVKLRPGFIRIHYRRSDAAYDQWGVWLWDDVAAPSANWPKGATPLTMGHDDFGAWADIPLAQNPQKISFLIVNRITGKKDGGNKIIRIGNNFVSSYHIYIREGDDRVYTSPDLRIVPTIKFATVTATGSVRVVIADAEALGDASPAKAISLTSVHGKTVPVSEVNALGNGVFVVKAEFSLTSDVPLVVSFEGQSVMAHLAWQLIDELYAYDGNDLGCTWHHGQAQLALWAPLASRVDLIVFDRNDQTREVGRMPMIRTDRGVWRCTVIPSMLLPPSNPSPSTLSTLSLPLSSTSYSPSSLSSSPPSPLSTQSLASSPPSPPSASSPPSSTLSPLLSSQSLGPSSYSPPILRPEPASVSSFSSSETASACVIASKSESASASAASSALSLNITSISSSSTTPFENTINSQATAQTVHLEPITDIRGYYYQFEVTNPGFSPKRVLDPYARSMAPVTVDTSGTSAGASGDFVGKAAFVDPDVLGPDPGTAHIDGYTKREDAIIYEVHIRDFTSDPNLAGELKSRWGTFSAFKERIDYIKDLGVTHIQLMPVMAWYFGDETRMHERELEWLSCGNNYNWGYDPQSYFSLDGAYSELPQDPQLRIIEFKELVKAVHEAGMGVILDVVYTHMAKVDFLEDIVPNYWFFKDSHGNFIGDFGNNLATNRHMVAKLIRDSVSYWFEKYKIDGMRWDMMGDATRTCVQSAFEAAVAINPRAIFIGEGWRTFKGHLDDSALVGQGADQDWVAETDVVGVFSDEFRNELKSGFGNEGEPRFLSGGARDLARLFSAICGQPSNFKTTRPGDVVQYIEAHDNLTLHDVIAMAIKKDPEIPENEREIQRRIRLGNAILLCSQGTVFLHAGQEWGRTKQWLGMRRPEQKFYEVSAAFDGKPFKHPYFIYDSYDSSDAVNRFDWFKACDAVRFPEQATTRRFTRGLIALRRSSDAFRCSSIEEVKRRVSRIEAPEMKLQDLVLAWKCTSTTGQTYRIFVNADTKPRTLTLPPADLLSIHDEVLVDAESAGTAPIASPKGFTLEGSTITIAPLTVVVFRR